ncbi:hypothetical protein L486_06700 [Kwoniella mangroviensis CBS 10435]|uniref:Zn(2)-C6 fungal-type domain-containing protein n=1 Tax=Kwoniella mangroviensis CBS 10435 TaxID=1331196 RepID=A0A1B9IKE3_9TREE|nr:hypothetical protein L486_06700 [Kwoniella mangroviensis CBS 10435]
MSYQIRQPPSSFFDPTNIPVTSLNCPPNYPETYLDRLVRSKQSVSPAPSSAACDQFYNNNDYSYNTYNSRPGMSAAAVSPMSSNQPHTMMANMHLNMQKNMMSYPDSATVRQPPALNPAPPTKQAYPTPYAAQAQNVAQKPSRFQQLLDQKFAAEQRARNATAASPQPSHQNITTSSDYLQHVRSQMTQQANDTVFHKDFVSNQYTQPFQAQQQPAQPPQLVNKPQTPQVYPIAQNPSQSYTNVPAQYPAQQQAPLPQQPQSQPRRPSEYSPSAHSSNNPINVASFNASHLPVNIAPSVQSNSGPPWRSTPYSQLPGAVSSFNTPQLIPSSSVSAPPPVSQNDNRKKQWIQNAGMNGWTNGPVNTGNIPLAPSHFQQQVAQPQVTPSFSWNVTDEGGESSYNAHTSFDRTSVRSPSRPSTSSSSLPVTPTAATQYSQCPNNANTNRSTPFLTVKIEPDTHHLTVPSTSQPQNISPTSSGSSSVGGNSPLFEYGARMFTNMNGSFSLPGPAMYMASTNGGGAGGPSTLANGMAGGDGGGGGEDCSNGGTGEESGSGGQDGSGSGSGGDGNGNNGNGDQNDDNNTNGGGGSVKKGKKLTLACHFCRRRKLKCNGVQPRCDNCTKRNEHCSWDGNVRRRGPGKATKERREKAAREALAAGLTNEDSCHADTNTEQHQHDHQHIEGGEHDLVDLPIVVALNSLPDLQEDSNGEFRLDHSHLQSLGHDPNVISGQGGEEGLESITLDRLPELHQDNDNNDDIPIDPALAALSAVLPVPGTLAELETPQTTSVKAEKRKSGVDIEGVMGLDDESAKRMKLDENTYIQDQ